MLHTFSLFFSRVTPGVRRRLVLLLLVLVALHGAVWVLLLSASYHFPMLLGLAALAYGFGLRHAVDADHIAAIDTTVRMLMQQGKKPVAVGFFFSLGHSVVVILLSAAIAFSAGFVQQHLPGIKAIGSVIGTAVSSGFLLVIGFINLIVLIDVVKVWRRVSREKLEVTMRENGFMSRLLRPMLRLVGNSWNMFFVGFLFGLGFDTATEVGLLSLSAATATAGVPVWAILLLPLAFTAGMTLIDSLDGVLMLGAYGWASVHPVRKLYYNMNITLVSVLTSLFIGGVEGLQLLGEKLGSDSGIFGVVHRIDLSHFGYVIVAVFLVSFGFSYAFYRMQGYNALDTRDIGLQ